MSWKEEEEERGKRVQCGVGMCVCDHVECGVDVQASHVLVECIVYEFRR